MVSIALVRPSAPLCVPTLRTSTHENEPFQFAACILIVGAAICAGSINNAMFLVGRVINGLGIGALVTVSTSSEHYQMLFC